MSEMSMCNTMSKILFCVLLSVSMGISTAEDYVYELHVTLPPAVGQDQTKEIKTIQKIITDNVKREDSYVFKHISSPEVCAILTIESARIWEDISDAFTVRGYIYEVTPLRKAEVVAEGTGVLNDPKPLQPGELNRTRQYSLWHGTLLQKDRTNAEYRALLKRHAMKYKEIGSKAQQIAWLVVAKEPVSVVVISPYLPQEDDKVEHAYEADTEVEEQQFEITPVVLLDSFKNTHC